MSEVVSYERIDRIVVITIDNPPVNAMGHAARRGLCAAVAQFNTDANARIAVLLCAGRTFIAGADISEFDQPPLAPWLPEVVQTLEASPKPIVAAIHGTALGGGLEVAMGCHYRCAVAAAKVGLPEVALGLLPGATGTQRLPRLAGVGKALDMMLSGKPVSAGEAHEHGIIDEIIAGELREGAIAYAERLLEQDAPPRRVSQLRVDKADLDAEFFSDYRQQIARQARGFFAPQQIIQCVEAAVELPYEEALAVERERFTACRESGHSRAQRHLFFAERAAAKIPDVPKDSPLRAINKVAVIGAGTMGGGIAMNLVNAGLPVTLLETDEAGLERGLGSIRSHYEAALKKGRMTQAQLEERMRLINAGLDDIALADADLVIEAVFENMAIKKQVFERLDAVCKPGAILASNTSSLDVNAIAAATRRAEDVIGLHFFAPANVMPLLEIVRATHTAPEVIATAMALAKTLRKTAVLVGVCYGFVGNRMFFPYIREAQMLLLEGVSAARIDQVAYDWGMAMGPHAVSDLSGLDVFYKLYEEWEDKPDDPAYFRMGIELYKQGRYGQKSGAGIYQYDGRTPLPDPAVAELAARLAEELDIAPREISDEEIIERLFYPMINEGARILEEGIALRPGDIDVVFANGYGMPRYRGGPMFYADALGLKTVHAGICKYRERYGERYWTPAPLLEKLAQAGSTFADWQAAQQ